jgi:hypothetical protein
MSKRNVSKPAASTESVQANEVVAETLVTLLDEATEPAAPAPSESEPQVAPAKVMPYANAEWAPGLPKSLVAKGESLLAAPKGVPAALVGVRLLPGKPFVARSAHNKAWAEAAVAACEKAKAEGGATVADVLAAGVGMHSIVAYVQRGWLVASKPAA